MKDHLIRETVNELTRIARDFHHTQQLRDRIAGVIVPLLKGAPDPAPQPVTTLLYAVFKVGVYRHECGGVFSTLEVAEAAARGLIVGERDDYHDYEVVPFVLDETTPQSAGNGPRESPPGMFWWGGDLGERPAALRLTRNGFTITTEAA